MRVDYLIVGGGIAGASLAYWLAPHGRSLILERESQPGYHSTGRSAAVFSESYGPPPVRALARASRDFLLHPPARFAEHSLLSERGALFVAEPHQVEQLESHAEALRSDSTRIERLDAALVRALVPVLREERVLGALHDPAVCDIDVHALHQGFLRGFRSNGGQILCGEEVSAIERGVSSWKVWAGGQAFEASVLINAAGAWCDHIAMLAGVRPIGILPKRRAAFVFAPQAGLECRRWPMVIGIDESWYMKPDAGLLLGSPANADPVLPHDVQPEEIDIATGIHRIHEMSTLTIRRPSRTWAGLRSFVADGAPVVGFDPDAPSFFWIVGQGGYGIQIAPALGRLAAALASGSAAPVEVTAHGVPPATLSPSDCRFPHRARSIQPGVGLAQ